MNIEEFIKQHPECIDTQYIDEYINEQIRPLLEVNGYDDEYIRAEIENAQKCINDMFVAFRKYGEASNPQVCNIVKVYLSNKERLRILKEEQEKNKAALKAIAEPERIDYPEDLLRLFRNNEANLTAAIEHIKGMRHTNGIFEYLNEKLYKEGKTVKYQDIYSSKEALYNDIKRVIPTIKSLSAFRK